MKTKKERVATAKKIIKLADEGGTIQATEMLSLTSEPTMHTTCSMERAAEHLGCVEELEELLER